MTNGAGNGDVADATLKLTKFRNNKGLLSKTAKLVKVSTGEVEGEGKGRDGSVSARNDDGACHYELTREGAGKLYDGTWETVSVLWKDFGQLLDGVAFDEALCLGLWRERGQEKGTVTKGTRTKANFDWPSAGAGGVPGCCSSISTASRREKQYRTLSTP